MSTRSLLIGALPAGLVGLAIGYALGGSGAPEPEAPPSAPDVPTAATPDAPTRAAAASCDEAAAEAEALRVENALLQKMLDDSLRAEDGAPLEWPDELPDAFTPEGFEPNVAEALAACQPGVELIGVDCSEPPCFALFRPTEDGWYDALMEDCPEWRERFPRKGPQYFWDLDCEGGAQPAAAIAWSPWSVPAIAPTGYEAERNFSKRSHTRASAIRDAFPCR